MKGIDVYRELVPLLKDEPTVCANGYISRELFNVKDREENFYMIGSMGLASSIGLGVALARPDKKTLIFDGDGNVLMAMGTLAMIAAGNRRTCSTSSSTTKSTSPPASNAPCRRTSRWKPLP